MIQVEEQTIFENMISRQIEDEGTKVCYDRIERNKTRENVGFYTFITCRSETKKRSLKNADSRACREIVFNVLTRKFLVDLKESDDHDADKFAVQFDSAMICR